MRPAPSICIAGNLYFVFWKYIFHCQKCQLVPVNALAWLSVVVGLTFRVTVSPGKSLKFETLRKINSVYRLATFVWIVNRTVLVILSGSPILKHSSHISPLRCLDAWGES